MDVTQLSQVIIFGMRGIIIEGQRLTQKGGNGYGSCSEDIEHVRHVFMECKYAKGCWECISRDIDITKVEDLSVWLLDKLGTETEVKLVHMAKILRGIWFARNKRDWDGKIMSPSVAMEISMKMVLDWRAAQSMAQGNMQTAGNIVAKDQVKWQKPPSGWYKVNVDAAIHVGSTWFKVGMVLRNDKGEFVAGMHNGFEEDVTILERKQQVCMKP
ncbi:uncharacterized protein LOC141685614 [Apium graveolens]|uniref:uncharacterized protein LOC141685614 n=1 Tax=Apium graveolens TaxID=4045 RepID=UPI003D7A75A6